MGKWKPIERIPADRRDGRPMHIQTFFRERRKRLARYDSASGRWIEATTGGVLLAVKAWADLE